MTSTLAESQSPAAKAFAGYFLGSHCEPLVLNSRPILGRVATS